MKARRRRFDIRRQGLPILVGLGIVIVVNTLSWAVLVRPKVAEFTERTQAGGSDRQRDLEEFRTSIESGEEYVTGLDRAERDWVYLREEVLATRSERMIQVQRELTRLCAEFRINLDTVTYRNEKLQEEGLDRFAMVVPLKGGYASLRRFLQAVEASDLFLVVERVALAETREGSGVSLQLNITLASYFELADDRGKRGKDDA